MNLFRHKHEIETGRTSSVGMEILGFDTVGEVVVSDTPGSRRPFGFCRQSDSLTITRKTVVGRDWETQRQGHYLH